MKIKFKISIPKGEVKVRRAYSKRQKIHKSTRIYTRKNRQKLIARDTQE